MKIKKIFMKKLLIAVAIIAVLSIGTVWGLTVICGQVVKKSENQTSISKDSLTLKTDALTALDNHKYALALTSFEEALSQARSEGRPESELRAIQYQIEALKQQMKLEDTKAHTAPDAIDPNDQRIMTNTSPRL